MVPSFRACVVLVKVTCGLRWVWSNGRNIVTGGNRNIGTKHAPVPLCPPQIPHEQASAVRGRRPPTWARSSSKQYLKCTSYLTENTLCHYYKFLAFRAVWCIIALYCDCHTKYVIAFCGQNLEILMSKQVVHIFTTVIIWRFVALFDSLQKY